MGSQISESGKLYSSKGSIVFVASGKSCPRINLTSSSKTVKLRDDFSKGLKASKSITKLIFS